MRAVQLFGACGPCSFCFVTALPEREDEQLCARIEELDIELTICDRCRLTDQLIHAGLV
jgi:hypothetical protein